ncbi:hypothetical protein [Streptococcus sp. S784/96/1]|uniref:hypothetical protein n=1 Tax=Streptococcus sp. S784/96/1 TaxID=2653499 RepID=UPI00138695D7|nr:hypothetical protein [Streptococcus sp. S784/96/1]
MKSKVLKSLMLATLVLGASGNVPVIAESTTSGTSEATTIATEVPEIKLVKRQMNSDKDRLSLVFNRTNQKYSEASIGIFNEAGELVEGAYIYTFVSFKEGHNNTDQFINSINFKDGTYTAGVRWTEEDYLANDYDMATFTFTVKDGHFVDHLKLQLRLLRKRFQKLHHQ